MRRFSIPGLFVALLLGCLAAVPASAQVTNGSVKVSGPAADNATASGNPVQVGGVDTTGKVQAVVVGAGGEAAVATSALLADGQASVTALLITPNGSNASALQGVLPLTYNGSTWDLQRGNTEGTLLASATRTATTTTPDQTNYNARGVLVFFNITAVSGTGGLTLSIQWKDPVSGTTYSNLLVGSALTTAGARIYQVYPAASGGTASTGAALPRTWRVSVAHGDASNYTYSVGYAYVN